MHNGETIDENNSPITESAVVDIAPALHLSETELKLKDIPEDVESAVKQEDSTDENPIPDTTQTTISITELMDPMDVGPLIKIEIEDVKQVIVKEETDDV